MEPESPTRSLDLRGVTCPFDWAQAKLTLEEMAGGELLKVFLDDGEPIRNVPRSVKAEGHKIIRVEAEGEGFSVWIRKGDGP